MKPAVFRTIGCSKQAEAWARDVTTRQEPFTPPMQVDPVTASREHHEQEY
jgi:hypothetical protein